MFSGQCVFVVLVICCPAAVQTDALETYYNMTNGFLDFIQPSAGLSGTKSRIDFDIKVLGLNHSSTN